MRIPPPGEPSATPISDDCLRNVPSSSNSNINVTPPYFTAEQIPKFEHRLANGFDLFVHQDYVSWLKYYHPNSLPSHLRNESPSHVLSSDDTITPLDIDIPSIVPSNEVPLDYVAPSNDNIMTPRAPSLVNNEASVSQSLASARKVLSDVSEFLTFPAKDRGSKKRKQPGGARVLTSEQSLAMILEKEKKKREEEAAKELRKKEREEKKVQREAEKQQKAKERELKAIERQKKQAEKTAAAEEKRKQREAKKKEKSINKVFVTRSRSGCAAEHSESSTNECTVCFGLYSDDLSEDGAPAREWIQCPDESCSKWMHEYCAAKDQDGHCVCVCGSMFV